LPATSPNPAVANATTGNLLDEGRTAMRRLLNLVIGFVFALGLISPAAAAGEEQGDTPESAKPFTTTISDEIAGDVAGSFEYFTIDYGDQGRIGRITLHVTSDVGPGVAEAVGVNLWKDGSLVATGSAVSSNPQVETVPNANTITFAAPTSGQILVQLYNYNSGIEVNYEMGLEWVESPTEEADAPAGPLGGTLVGNPGGSYAHHELWSPGDGSTQAVAVTITPNGMDVTSGVFVNLYQNGTLIASRKGSDAVSGVLTLQFTASTPGPVEVQIDNQTGGSSISYTVSQSQVVVVKQESSGGDEEGGPEE
jgi:hypothetical protein